MKRALILFILSMFCLNMLWAEELSESEIEEESDTAEASNLMDGFYGGIEIDLDYDISAQNPFYQYGVIELGYNIGYFDVFGSFSVCNDGKYQPSHGDDLFFGYYFYLESGGFKFNYDYLSLTFGRTTQEDVVDTPYSLFVSSKIIPTLLADVSFDNDIFFFTSRWTELNRDSSMTYTTQDGEESWPDRGWQYNTYGIYIKDFKFGFQDSLIYTDESFDPEYFLNPLPGFFKQYVRISSGKPWTVEGDANSIMGFFVEWNPSKIYAYGQLLIDDFNANAILNPDSVQNPNKIAWSVGGRYEFNWGTLGFYNAGATKYTFQSSGTTSGDYLYGYSFYPSTTYTANGVVMPIELEDTYIGYYNGENNLSFLVDYEATWVGIGIYSSLEFSLSGSKSPANAWSQYSWWTEEDDAGTKFLDSDVLEKKLVLTVGASRSLKELGAWAEHFIISMSLEAGYIWNVLELTDTLSSDVNQEEYWAPSENNEAVFSVTLGVCYRI
ncbi:MAG: hypothetical protein PQJ46_11220 [Spirochaetales bacterium]|nr:hypothetical protein [Spirochaetales bacterium]